MVPKGLQGPFTLSTDTVNKTISGKLPGVYALGHTDAEGTFVLESVGRSDENVQDPLYCLADTVTGEFLFQHFHSAKAAFEKECEIHHDCLSATDAKHPTRPDGSYWKCPGCHLFD